MQQRSRLVAVVATIATLCLLSACGGGSGGGNGGTSSSSSSSGTGTGSVSLSLSTHSVVVSADAGTSSTPTSAVTATISGNATTDIYVGGRYTHTGISNLSAENTSNGVVQLNIQFADPSVIGPGTYQDTISVELCTDSACQNVVTSQTVDVRYTVTGHKPIITVTASTNSIQVQGLVFTNQQPGGSVELTMSQLLATGYNVSPSYTSNGIQSITVVPRGPTDYQVQIAFKTASALGAGTYNDTIILDVCVDQACATPLTGSPLTVTTQYTVSNTATGTNGFTAQLLNLNLTDIAWDRFNNLFYVGTAANTVEALNPVDGTVGAPTPVTSYPRVVMPTDDGQFLYVAMQDTAVVQRFRLPALTLDSTYQLGNDPASGNPLYPRDVAVMPGAPHTIALSSLNGVSLLDDGVARPDIVALSTISSAATVGFSADSSSLYASQGASEQIILTKLQVDASGLVEQTSSSQSDASSDGFYSGPQYLGGSVYTGDGLAFDATTLALKGRFLVPDGAAPGSRITATVADAVNGRLFAVLSVPGSSSLQSYDLTTFAPLANIALTGLDFNAQPRLIRWGDDGLAVVTNQGLLLVKGPFVKPQ